LPKTTKPIGIAAEHGGFTMSVAGMRWFLSAYTPRFNHAAQAFWSRLHGTSAHLGELKRESVEAKAQRIVAAELKRLHCTECDLEQGAKSAPEKLALAARLRRETTLTRSWISARLPMRAWKGLNAKLHRRRKVSGIL
jgi:hypothetical protein